VNHYALNHGVFLRFAITVINPDLATSHKLIQEILPFVVVPMKERWGCRHVLLFLFIP